LNLCVILSLYYYQFLYLIICFCGARNFARAYNVIREMINKGFIAFHLIKSLGMVLPLT
jgi:pentatricopeptide repeat protein